VRPSLSECALNSCIHHLISIEHMTVPCLRLHVTLTHTVFVADQLFVTHTVHERLRGYADPLLEWLQKNIPPSFNMSIPDPFFSLQSN
jgi:hypothetical protein